MDETLIQRLRARKGFFLNGSCYNMATTPDTDCAEAADEIERLEKALESCRQERGWTPTAVANPAADGWFLVYRAGFPHELSTAYWHDGMWCDGSEAPEELDVDGCLAITHWQLGPPLPEAPPKPNSSEKS